MRNFGRAIAAFTIWAAAAAAFAHTQAESQAESPADSQAELQAESQAGDPVADNPTVDSPIAVAPMWVSQVTVAPTASKPTPTAPVAVAPTGPAPMVAVPQAVYVTNFIAVPAGSPPSGLLARLRAALHSRSAGHDAGLVAQAVAQMLSHAGVAARYLAPDEPPPAQGWLISGAFHVSRDALAAASGTDSLGADGSGISVTVTVSDLEHSADTPFAVIGAPPAASDEPDKWHPYVLPASLSFEHADRNAAVAALAQKISDTFVGNMTALRQADARAISP